MVAMASLAYPIATFMSHRAQNTPREPTIQSSIPVPPSLSKLTKRKNYLRHKILKTLNKPQHVPLSPPKPEDPINPVQSLEPNLEVMSEPTLERSSSSFIQESETLIDANESSIDQLQVVQASEGQNMGSFNVFSGRTIVRIFASVVGLFILQTVVTVWVFGTSDSDEKESNLGIEVRHRDLRLGMRKGEVGLNGNGFLGHWASQNTGESEMEAKIAEIRKMARAAREVEKKESLKSDEPDITDISDDDDHVETDDPGMKSNSPRIQSGIVKEVDKRLTKLRKGPPIPVLYVNFLNKAGDSGNKGKTKDKDHEEDNMLMFQMKRKFRSHLTTREKPMNMDDEQLEEMTGNANGNGASSENDSQKINGRGSSSPGRSNIDSQIDENKPLTESSGPLQASKKGFGSNGTTNKLNKQQASKKKSGSKIATKKLNKRNNEGANAKPDRGVVQDSSRENPMEDGSNIKDSSVIVTQYSQRKMNDQDASTASKTHVMSSFKVQPDTEKLGSKLSLSKDNDIWWSTLPCVLVILMQTGPESEGKQGFYTVRISSDAKNQSYTSYIVAFEDRSDARNFNYLLGSAFEDLPDATIDVVPLSAKELKDVTKTLKKKVIVVKKGELQLYAGQPLEEVESALRSLVK